MEREESPQSEPQPTQPETAPRGNPEPEQDIVEEGQEQLDKISGN